MGALLNSTGPITGISESSGIGIGVNLPTDFGVSLGIKDDEFKKEFISMFQQVESDFLENIEMYLFQKRVYRKWKIFKVVAFIPFMLFLSELVEVIFGMFFEDFISN